MRKMIPGALRAGLVGAAAGCMTPKRQQAARSPKGLPNLLSVTLLRPRSATRPRPNAKHKPMLIGTRTQRTRNIAD
jgi:hypothetical protein